MNKLKDLINYIFTCVMICLGIFVAFLIGTDIYKNIRVANNIKKDSVCLEINNDIFCRVDYDITIKYNNGEL